MSPLEVKVSCFLSCFARTSSLTHGRFASQLKTPNAHMKSRVDRGLLCVICHSVIDDITCPAYGETTGHRWIPVTMDAWNQHLDSRPKGCGETTVMWWNHRSPVNSRRKGSVELIYGGPVCGDSITIDQQCIAGRLSLCYATLHWHDSRAVNASFPCRRFL